MTRDKFKSFKAFYPYYLSEHKLKINKILHMIGSFSGLSFLTFCIISKKFYYAPLSLVFGYFFAWIGHFVFEKNKPATFQYPLYSFISDWVMLKDILIGKIKI